MKADDKSCFGYLIFFDCWQAIKEAQISSNFDNQPKKDTKGLHQSRNIKGVEVEKQERQIKDSLGK